MKEWAGLRRAPAFLWAVRDIALLGREMVRRPGACTVGAHAFATAFKTWCDRRRIEIHCSGEKPNFRNVQFDRVTEASPTTS